MNTTAKNKSKEELVRGYCRLSKAWYATDKDLAKPTIMIGMYNPEGGTAGEISVRWEALQDKMVPRLSAFDDAWKVLSSFTDLFKEMAKWDNKDITEEQLSQLLDKTGFTDLTPYTQHLKPGKQPRAILPSNDKGLKK